MPRQVITRKEIEKFLKVNKASKGTADAVKPVREDQYSDRLLKYIPAEVVVCYLFVQGVIQKLTDTTQIIFIQWIVFCIFLLLTYLYLRRILSVYKVQQLAISVVSFAIWVFALGGPFALMGWYNPVYGEILLPVFTFGIAIWEAKK